MIRALVCGKSGLDAVLVHIGRGRRTGIRAVEVPSDIGIASAEVRRPGVFHLIGIRVLNDRGDSRVRVREVVQELSHVSRNRAPLRLFLGSFQNL